MPARHSPADPTEAWSPEAWTSDGWIAASALVKEAVRLLDKRCEGLPDGIPTGFAELDESLGGLPPDALTVLTGPSGTTLTDVWLHLVLHGALPADLGVAVFSPGRDVAALATRLLILDATLPLAQVGAGTLDEDGWDDTIRTAEHLSKAPLVFDDRVLDDAQQVEERLEELPAGFRAGLVVVDDVPAIAACGHAEEPLPRITARLGALARDRRIAVLAVVPTDRTADPTTDSHAPDPAGPLCRPARLTLAATESDAGTDTELQLVGTRADIGVRFTATSRRDPATGRFDG